MQVVDTRTAPLRLYVEVARRAFRRFSTYRAATIAGAFTNTVFGFLKAYVLLAVFRQQPDIGGFRAADAATFVFLAQGFLAPIGAFWPLDIAERVRTGDVVTDLYRPVDFQLYWFAHDLGRAGFHVLARGIPPWVAGAMVFDLRAPADMATAAAFAVALALAIALSFALRFVVNLTAFWLLDVRGVLQLYVVLVIFFSGIVVPVTFFPGWLETVARWLPFVAMLQLPVEVWLGLPAGGSIAEHLGVQMLWMVAAFAGGRLMLRAAVRRVVVQGG